MDRYVASAQVIIPTSETIMDEMCDHFEEHGLFVSKKPGAYTVAAGLGLATYTISENGITVEAEADRIDELLLLRSEVASHLIEFAKEAIPDFVPEFVWTGAGSNLSRPSNFRLIQVSSVNDVTPHMRRITFNVEDIARFDSNEDFHVRLFLPRKNDVEPEWPSYRQDGTVQYSRGDRAPFVRTYTIRQVDQAAGTINIDFVLHDHDAPASKFAKAAQSGDVIGMLGPSGGSVPLGFDWYLLACDDTGIPPLARALENMPEHAKGIAYIEVSDTSAEMPIRTNSNIEVKWLHRNGATPGTTTLLTNAVRETKLPADRSSVFFWSAAEYETFRSVRHYLRNELSLRRDQYQVVSYWRTGKAETTSNMRQERIGNDAA